MKEAIKKLLSKIEKSFDTGKEGFSARKLTAFAIVFCVILAHAAWLKKSFMKEDFSLLSEILVIDYTFIAALFGMTTYSGIKQSKTEPQ